MQNVTEGERFPKDPSFYRLLPFPCLLHSASRVSFHNKNSPQRYAQLGEDYRLLAVLIKITPAISNTQQVGICWAAFTAGKRDLGMLYVSMRDGVESTGISAALTQ